MKINELIEYQFEKYKGKSKTKYWGLYGDVKNRKVRRIFSEYHNTINREMEYFKNYINDDKPVSHYYDDEHLDIIENEIGFISKMIYESKYTDFEFKIHEDYKSAISVLDGFFINFWGRRTDSEFERQRIICSIEILKDFQIVTDEAVFKLKSQKFITPVKPVSKGVRLSKVKLLREALPYTVLSLNQIQKDLVDGELVQSDAWEYEDLKAMKSDFKILSTLIENFQHKKDNELRFDLEYLEMLSVTYKQLVEIDDSFNWKTLFPEIVEDFFVGSCLWNFSDRGEFFQWSVEEEISQQKFEKFYELYDDSWESMMKILCPFARCHAEIMLKNGNGKYINYLGKNHHTIKYLSDDFIIKVLILEKDDSILEVDFYD